MKQCCRKCGGPLCHSDRGGLDYWCNACNCDSPPKETIIKNVKSKKSEQFLKEFYKRLKDSHWGVIEPDWFDPEYIEDDPSELDWVNEQREWARELQDIVHEIFLDIL